MDFKTDVMPTLLRENLAVFSYKFGTKKVDISTLQRRKRIVKSIEEVNEYANYHLLTGDGNSTDIDLDCKESEKLAEHFLPPTGLKYGRKSKDLPSHYLYKVLDLNKKHTRKFFKFKDPDADKEMLVELRSNDHYSMCGGKYEDDDHVKWFEASSLGETTYDALYKQCALLSLASIMLRLYPNEGMRNDFIWKLTGALWHHKVEEEDALKLIESVAKVAEDDVKERLAKVRNVYKTAKNSEVQGLPKLAEKYKLTKEQVSDLKEALYAITGRHDLPPFTHEFINRIAYMMKQKKYYDLEDKEMYDGEAIDIKYAKYFNNARYTPLLFWKRHPDSKVCVDFTYKPNDPNRFVKVSKKLMINVFEKHDLVPDKKVDTDIFWALLKHVIPHEKERNHFLDWYAYPLQYPGHKIRSAIILQSDEFQLGKGSLFDLHRDMLGHNNTRKIELAEALDKGKGYLINAQTVLIDEAKSSGSWSEKAQLINTLKTIITEGTIGVRQLYKEYSEQDTCTNYWINTNYKDAFPLPYNEVRYWVYFSPAKRNQQMLDEFHLQRTQGNLAAGVLAELMDRDLSKFNPLAPAPHTVYRDEMCQLADRPINDFVKEAYDQGVHPFDRDMVTTVELFDYLKREKRMKVTREREVATALKLLHGSFKKAGVTVAGVGDNVTVWVIRNHDQYQHLTAKEIGRKYAPFYTE